MTRAILALEDGRSFEGLAFGATGSSFGEVCFNTSMTGYQEVLTDPSYRGQIVAMTYPMIGNYGVNQLDSESGSPHVRGFVIEELCESPSNWRSEGSLSSYLAANGIIGIQGVDTRSLTKHLRERGAMRALLTTEEISPQEACTRAAQSPGMAGMDYVKEVTTPEPYRWDADGSLSREWTLPNPTVRPEGIGVLGEEHFLPLGEPKYHIVAYDFGIKHNILRNLRQHGFTTDVVGAGTSAAEVLDRQPDGVFLSNGPGDPDALSYIHSEIRELLGNVPIFGICLGHQILSHALGGQTFKLKFGHRGGNQPVKDLRSGKVSITSQNHGFAVDGETLPEDVEITHINLNDNTVEGLRHKHHPAFSVQYHPEAAPGPHDAAYFFDEFAKLIEQSRSNS